MQPYMQRVVDEKSALDSKLALLDKFIQGSIFAVLPAAERERLYKQSDIMRQYADILGERIAAFPSIREGLCAT